MNFKVEKDLMYRGYRCVVLGQPMGHRCGYVGVEIGTPLYGIDYDNFDFNVHGGLTYSGDDKNYPVESNLWWLGFDCAHYLDAKDWNLLRELTDESTFKLTYDMENKFPTGGIVRTTEYVLSQCMGLIDQILEYESE